MSIYDEPKIDCHNHLFEPARFAYRADTVYSPVGQEVATLEQFARVMGAYGRIVNVTSMAGKDGVQYISGYSAAKAGVIAFTKAVAKELAQDGVLLNCIAPAMVETGLMAQMTPEHIAASKAKIPMVRFLQIEEIANRVTWIAGPECSITTGFVFDLSGGRATY